jgi:hypothetical protein
MPASICSWWRYQVNLCNYTYLLLHVSGRYEVRSASNAMHLSRPVRDYKTVSCCSICNCVPPFSFLQKSFARFTYRFQPEGLWLAVSAVPCVLCHPHNIVHIILVHSHFGYGFSFFVAFSTMRTTLIPLPSVDIPNQWCIVAPFHTHRFVSVSCTVFSVHHCVFTSVCVLT